MSQKSLSSKAIEVDEENSLFNGEEKDLKDVPTLFQKEKFDKHLDAEKLRKSMKGLGTDEQPIIEILCNRSNRQRQELKKAYNELYKRDLVKDLNSEISGHFRKTIQLLMKEPAELDAYYIRKALMAPTADYKTMIEILATRSCFEINGMKKAYEEEYGEIIEQELQNKFYGPLLILMNKLVREVRSISKIITKSQIDQDLADIFKNESFNQEKFIHCVSLRSYTHLRAMFAEFQKINGIPIEERLEQILSESNKESTLYLVQCIRNKYQYFASTLYDSMIGVGTNDYDLIRVILTRCEVDLHNIKTKFDFMYNTSLADFIKSDTTGYYCKALLTLIGEPTNKVWEKFGEAARIPIRLISSKLNQK